LMAGAGTDAGADDGASSVANKLFWFGTVLVPLNVFHTIVCYSQGIWDGPIGFPGFQLTVLQLIFQPAISVAGKLLGTGEGRWIAAGMFALFVIPIPFLLYCIWFIRTQITPGDIIYGQEVPRVAGHQKPPRWYLLRPEKGRRMLSHSFLFAATQGGLPKPVPLIAVFKLDPETKRFIRYRRAETDEERGLDNGATEIHQGLLGKYYRVYAFIRAGIVTLILGAWRSGRAAPVQLGLLSGIAAVHFSALAIGHPLADTGAWIAEMVQGASGMGTYTMGLTLTVRPEWRRSLDMGLVICQILGIGAMIVYQGIGMVGMARDKIDEWRRRRGIALLTAMIREEQRKWIWAKKWGNRWKYRALREPMNGWPIPDGVVCRKTQIEVNPT